MLRIIPLNLDPQHEPRSHALILPQHLLPRACLGIPGSLTDGPWNLLCAAPRGQKDRVPYRRSIRKQYWSKGAIKQSLSTRVCWSKLSLKTGALPF